MNSNQITTFLQEHSNWVTLISGAVVLIGAINNWNWLCDSAGKPMPWIGRGGRRLFFFVIGILMIVLSIWSFLLSAK